MLDKTRRNEKLFYREKRMPSLSGSTGVDLKTQKRRRRSLDESLINPFKAFVVSTRLRRQSTTDATNFGKSNFYNNDRRRRRSENEYFSSLPIQDTTKERLLSAVSRSSSLKDNNDNNSKHTPKMFRRLSRHLGRHSYLDYEDEKRPISIHEIPKDSDHQIASSGGAPPDRFRHVRKQFDRMSLDASSLSTDSGVDMRDDKSGSNGSFEGTGQSNDGDRLDGGSRDVTASSFNRSLSENDVLSTETDKSFKKLHKKSSSTSSPSSKVHQQHSFDNETSKNPSPKVSTSSMVFRTSQEKLNVALRDEKTEEKTQLINEFNSRNSLRKKKNLLQPLVERLRKTSRSESFDTAPKVTALDSPGMEKIVSEILREKMKGLRYDHTLSKERCRTLSTTIEKTLKVRLMAQPGYPDYKVVALVYIGETKDNGIFFATQCSYQPADDLFATATYQNEEMYVCTTVLATQLQKLT